METMTLDWKEYCETAREAAGDGIVLLKNDNGVLPLEKGNRIAVFGRIQAHYYRSGTGSGGLVNVNKVTGILDALLEEPDLDVNRELMERYREFEEVCPFEAGQGWGMEPWSQEEMELTDEICARAAEQSDTAIVIIGRTAGEDRDNRDLPGAYRLTEKEETLLKKVRAGFDRMAVLLNVGNIIDMSFVEKYDPDAVLYVWQGGMVGGYGVADVLMGRKSPSGKLSDTIARHISDYPSDRNFGACLPEKGASVPEGEGNASQEGPTDLYQEDIYVGYRYFETAAREKVLYPFGFGLSYTSFEVTCGKPEKSEEGKTAQIRLEAQVKNTGARPGREVVQVYVRCPQGRLGKPFRSLAGFEKTKELQPGETETLRFSIPMERLASYDDSGVTGHKSCWLLEEGRYTFYVGTDVRSAAETGSVSFDRPLVLEELEEAMAPVRPFLRLAGPLKEGGNDATRRTDPADGDECAREGWDGWKLEPVPLRTQDMEQRRLARLPEEIAFTGNRKIRLEDVKAGRASMEQFVAQLSDEDLCCMVRGEGMGSPKVTPGTAAAFGGVTPELKNAYGIPCGCCDDGPSGMRLDCGDKAFSLPGGTMLACTFDRELNRKLFALLGVEMVKNKVDCLLGPGVNIHRHPLNGRNFEYFSEDPYLTGEMAAAQLAGMHSAGVTGTVKHFCGNNQEAARSALDSVISERALREIYLKGFEIAVKKGGMTSVMTTYGKVNGTHTASLYDLTTTILRKEWGFCGIAMTDWWADMNDPEHPEGKKTNLAAMVRAQNDLYMVCPDAAKNLHGDNLEQALRDGTLTRAELQRCAGNICRFLIDTHAMERMEGKNVRVEVKNCPQEEGLEQAAPVEFLEVGNQLVLPLEDVCTDRGQEYRFGLELQRGGYILEFTACSDQGELAQLPVSIFTANIPLGTLTWNGTQGAWVTKRKKYVATTRYTVLKLYFGQSGLKLRDLKITFDRPASEIEDWDRYMEEEETEETP